MCWLFWFFASSSLHGWLSICLSISSCVSLMFSCVAIVSSSVALFGVCQFCSSLVFVSWYLSGFLSGFISGFIVIHHHRRWLILTSLICPRCIQKAHPGIFVVMDLISIKHKNVVVEVELEIVKWWLFLDVFFVVFCYYLYFSFTFSHTLSIK